MRTLYSVLVVTALLGCAKTGYAQGCDITAPNLIGNGGFETGDFTCWTVLNQDGNTAVEPNSFTPPGAYAGEWFGALGDAATDPVTGAWEPSTLEQTFSDVPGSRLTFDFYVALDGSVYSFAAEFDGDTLLNMGSTTPSTPAGYTLYSYTLTATGSDTISFVEEDPLGVIGLDNVSVVDPLPTPEPSYVILLAAAVLGVGVIRRLKAA